MPSYRYKKPEAKEAEYPDRVRRKIQYAKSIETEYQLTDADIKLIEFEKYKQTFAPSLITFVASLRKIRYEQAEDNPKAKDWLVYKLIESIKDKDGHSHTFESWHGIHTEPEPETKRNQFNEVTEVVVDRERIIYEIPFSRKAVQQVMDIKTRSNTPSDIAIGQGETYGIDSADPTRLPLLSVFSLEEFIQFRYDYLEGANKDGSLVPSYGGMLNYLDKMGIPYEEAMYEGEKVPDANANKPTFTNQPYTPSVQEQEHNLAKAKYKQTEARQKV